MHGNKEARLQPPQPRRRRRRVHRLRQRDGRPLAGGRRCRRSGTRRGGHCSLYALSASADGQAGLFQNSGGPAVRAPSSGATESNFGRYEYTAGGQFAGSNGRVAASSASGGFGVVAVQGKGNYALVAIGVVRVNGNLSVNCTLYKANGSFKIDHPLDPENNYLSHSFVESPDMMNV